MQMKVRRGQRAGALGGKVVFVLDVFVDLSAEERALVDRYKLWNECVYSSERAKENSEAAQGGSLKALGALIADRVMKNILSIKDLSSGQHIECKDLAQLLTVEDQVHAACGNIKKYLAVAQSFDGREIVVDIQEAA